MTCTELGSLPGIQKWWVGSDKAWGCTVWIALTSVSVAQSCVLILISVINWSLSSHPQPHYVVIKYKSLCLKWAMTIFCVINVHCVVDVQPKSLQKKFWLATIEWQEVLQSMHKKLEFFGWMKCYLGLDKTGRFLSLVLCALQIKNNCMISIVLTFYPRIYPLNPTAAMQRHLQVLGCFDLHFC